MVNCCLALYHERMTKPKSTLAERIRAARKAAGLTQEALASVLGVTSVAISQYESGNAKINRKPTLENIKKIAEATRTSVEWLLNDESDISHVGMVGEVIETGDYRKVPVVGNARLGNGGYYEDLGYPAGHGDGFLDIPSKDPNAFALRVKGNSMAPMIMDGWFVQVEPNGSIEPGEPVLVRKKNGEVMVKLFAHRRDNSVYLWSVGHGTLVGIEENEIDYIYPVKGIFPPSKYKPS